MRRKLRAEGRTRQLTFHSSRDQRAASSMCKERLSVVLVVVVVVQRKKVWLLNFFSLFRFFPTENIEKKSNFITHSTILTFTEISDELKKNVKKRIP